MDVVDVSPREVSDTRSRRRRRSPIMYGVLALAPIVVRRDAREALFLVGGAALGLLMTGIHNAWESVTHIAVISREEKERDGQPDRRAQ